MFGCGGELGCFGWCVGVEVWFGDGGYECVGVGVWGVGI